MPEATLPVILLTELKVPDTTPFVKDPTPLTKPKPPSNGPWTNPSYGISNKSWKPSYTFSINPMGFPNKSIEPASLYKFEEIASL